MIAYVKKSEDASDYEQCLIEGIIPQFAGRDNNEVYYATAQRGRLGVYDAFNTELLAVWNGVQWVQSN